MSASQIAKAIDYNLERTQTALTRLENTRDVLVALASAIDAKDRLRIVQHMDRYAITTAYNVPLLWWQRIIVNHKKIHGWYMTPSHYLWQDLTTVWLEQ